MRWPWIKLLWLAAIVVLSAPSAGALPRLEDLVRPGENLAALLPARESMSGVIYSRKKKHDAALNMETQVDAKTGDVAVVSNSTLYRQRAVLDRALYLREGTYTTTDAYTNEKLGHDRREARRTGDRLSIVYSKNGKTTQEKTVRYPFLTLDIDLLPVILEALLLKGIGDFTAEVVLGDRGWKSAVEFRQVKSRNFPALSPQFVFPKRFGRLAALPREYVVYVMRLTGLPGLLYPHKYYCAFEEAPPHRFVAYWGGEPDWVEFVVRRDLADEPGER
jgi:hypothetical protein